MMLLLWDCDYLNQTYLTDSQKHLLSEISGHQLLCEGHGLWCGCRLYNFLSSKQPRFYLSNIILKDKCLCLEAHFFANKKGILYKNNKCKDQSLCVVFHRREPQVQIIWSKRSRNHKSWCLEIDLTELSAVTWLWLLCRRLTGVFPGVWTFCSSWSWLYTDKMYPATISC